MEPRDFKDGIFAQFARIGAALGHAKRVEMIDVLMQGERSVESLAREVSSSVANTSRHLQILSSANLVSKRADGNSRVYRLADESIASAYLALVGVAEEHLTEITALAEDFFSGVDGAKAVSFDELDRLRNSDEAVLIDVRPASEFEAGHVAGAINIPLPELEARIAELPADLSIVAYCRGPYCVMAAQAVARLRDSGMTAARLSGGFPDWRSEGRAVRAAAH
ncbi:ArsR family transcriptional regulator [Leucobacter komagatae]|uniref:ArsR family transcriptional regulator n=1 Tax=Leucobacter komagatae TaxID=55969 RepID=A0A542XXZ5_9MICO|nr:metalloregulator ArsR/SmtB family transcription factor [Leucobacter komagatae]TQL40709.1 ArsR family transcriptional regulator [Leucobacter komagatae]